MYINGHKNVQKIGNPWKRNRKNRIKHILYIFVHVHLAKIWWPNRKKHILYIFVHFCTCTFGKNLVAKQEKTYFVHFCTFLYMYIWQKSGGHVQKCSWTPPPPPPPLYLCFVLNVVLLNVNLKFWIMRNRMI